MATRINREIKNDFKKYEALLKGYKNSSAEIVVLNQVKQRHPNQRISTTLVDHENIPEKIELIIESKIEDKRSFKFKLRAPEFTGEPFFRFDSDGVAHYNRTPSIPLPEQKIDTPHFNAFDENGKSIAYKSQALKNPGNVEVLLNDASMCMAHYCDEANIYFNKKHIEIEQTPSGELNLNLENENPLDGVKYE